MYREYKCISAIVRAQTEVGTQSHFNNIHVYQLKYMNYEKMDNYEQT